MVTTARFGEWHSPITTRMVARGGVRIGGIALDGGRAYWLEGRPRERGRTALMCRDEQGAVSEVVRSPHNVRSRVHEYGGGAFCAAGASVWFVDGASQRIHHVDGARPPRPLTAPGLSRYADLLLDTQRGRLLCVREQHFEDGREAVNTLVEVELADGKVQVLHQGHDFYASPCITRDGRRMAWLSWDHPDMPWDATTLWIAEVGSDGSLWSPRRIAGGGQASVFQPQFRHDGVLFFVADFDGWWNLHCWDGADVRCVLSQQAEFGRPQWQFGESTYGFDDRGQIVCSYCVAGRWRLALLDPNAGALEPLETRLDDIQALAVKGHRALLVGGSASRCESVVLVDLNRGSIDVLCESAPTAVAPGYVSTAHPIAFKTRDGAHAHAFFYPPCNCDFCAPDGERPPLIVVSHDGPTSATSPTLRWGIQFWTSRGFAVLDVDYRGSTGYGRAYRQALEGHWGVVDVCDCIDGARFVVDSGRADGQRLIIRGSSAGGYTTLAALAFHDVFCAGASYYGVGDVESLLRETHKFESRYLDRLIGPYPAARELYRERSPLYAAGRMSCPVIFFQGADDVVVPPTQALQMAEALHAQHVPVECLVFKGEEHGFRRSQTIERALRAELAFYARVLGLRDARRSRSG